MTKTETAAAEFHAADAAWGEELIKVFGKKSGPQMRYVTAGRGMHGSKLRQAYDAREAARIAFEAARQAERQEQEEAARWARRFEIAILPHNRHVSFFALGMQNPGNRYEIARQATLGL